ncbi:MAG: hypothetical protein HRT45_01750 [Bdellovibrionales bacterium]|nr:hypothetical protein [Bdellovibrionales bacterium]
MPYGYLVLKLAMYNSFNQNGVPRSENPYLATEQDSRLFEEALEDEVFTVIGTNSPGVHYGNTFSSIGVNSIDASKQLKHMAIWLPDSSEEITPQATERLRRFQAGEMLQSHQQVIDKIEARRMVYLEAKMLADIEGGGSCLDEMLTKGKQRKD